MKRILIVLITAWAIGPNALQAQWQSSVALTTSFDDNAFRNYAAQQDLINQANFYLARGWQASDWQGTFYYDGYLTHFADYDERTYQWHRVGAAAQRLIGKSGSQFSTGGNLTFRIDSEAYNLYDFSQLSGFARFKMPLRGLGIAYAGYDVGHRDYDHLTELSHWEHVIYGRFNVPLPTRTTVIFSTEIGYKDYLSQLIAEPLDSTGETGRGSVGRSGRGGVVYTELDNPSAGQWINQLRLSQSVLDRTGMSGYVRRRTNFGDGSRYLSGVESGYFTEDELYDDRYGYESWESGIMLTQLLPLGMSLQFGYDYYNKDYSRQALDLEGDPLPENVAPHDLRRQVWGSFEKILSLGSSGRRLKLSFEYLHINNDSNDPYYNYSAAVGTLGAEMSF